MNETTKKGIKLMVAALILGVAGNILIRSIPLGLNVALWMILLGTSVFVFQRKADSKGFDSNITALYAALVFFSSMFVFFDSAQLLVLDFFAIVLILVVLTVPVFTGKLTDAGISNVIAASFGSAVSAVFGPIALFAHDIKWGTVPKSGLIRHTFSVLRGLALAVPIVFVIGSLLMAADDGFQTFVQSNFNIDPELIMGHVGITGLISWAVLGYFRAAVFGIGPHSEIKKETKRTIVQPAFSVTEHSTEDPDKKQADKGTTNKDKTSGEKQSSTSPFQFPEWLRLGVVETSIVLGMMNLVFVGFLIFQLPYLFGGMDLVQQTPDFKLANYARRGVEEIIAVSILVLPILLTMHWLLKKGSVVNERVFRVLASVQIGLLFVVMVSAAQRLSLLTGSFGYGQTTGRLYSNFLLIWLALVFVWFGMTVLRGMRRQFVFGAIWSGLFIVGMLHYVNPDDYIARTNIALMEQGRSFDAEYNSKWLSADATPVLIDALPRMSENDKAVVMKNLDRSLCGFQGTDDIRSWNWSRSTSKTMLHANKLALGGCS